MKNKKLNFFLIVLIITVFIVLLFSQDKLKCFVTNYQLRNSDIILNHNDSTLFFSQFNNRKNTKDFEISLVEIGGVGCKPCMRMDTVLSEIKNTYKQKLNIKTYRVTNAEGKKIAKYFNVRAIPTQIILDKTGTQVFRHTGFISKNELEDVINHSLIIKFPHKIK